MQWEECKSEACPHKHITKVQAAACGGRLGACCRRNIIACNQRANPARRKDSRPSSRYVLSRACFCSAANAGTHSHHSCSWVSAASCCRKRNGCCHIGSFLRIQKILCVERQICSSIWSCRRVCPVRSTVPPSHFWDNDSASQFRRQSGRDTAAGSNRTSLYYCNRRAFGNNGQDNSRIVGF